jgi:hypothetical protein
MVKNLPRHRKIFGFYARVIQGGGGVISANVSRNSCEFA